MKYYSEKTKKFYESEKACEQAEKQLEVENKDKLAKAEQKKADAKVVEEAFHEKVEARKQAAKLIDEANEKFEKALNDFKKKYPEGYHMTFKDGNEVAEIGYSNFMEPFTDVEDMFRDMLNWSPFKLLK